MILSIKEHNAVATLLRLLKERKEQDPSRQKYHLIAAIVGHKGIETVGYNNVYKTHPQSKKRHRSHPCGDGFVKDTIHAEFACLTQHPSTLKGKKMIILRSNGGTSKPCACCMEMIQKSGIKKILYVEDQQYVKERIR